MAQGRLPGASSPRLWHSARESAETEPSPVYPAEETRKDLIGLTRALRWEPGVEAIVSLCTDPVHPGARALPFVQQDRPNWVDSGKRLWER